MLLRSTLERHLPLKEGEAPLSEKARKAVYRGGYLFPHPITEVLHVEHPAADSTSNPYALVVRRPVRPNKVKDIDPKRAAGALWPEPLDDVAAEMADPAKLRRANRVERVGRRITATGIALGMIGILAFGAKVEGTSGATSAPDLEPEVPEQVDYNLPDCLEWQDTDARIHEANPAALDQLKMQGEQLCEFEGKPYVLKINY